MKFRAFVFALISVMLSLGFVWAQRTKTSKSAPPPASKSAKNFAFNATQSQLTVLLIQEGLIRKIHPTHLVGVKNFSGRIQLPSDESKVAVQLDADAKSFANIDADMKDFERSGFHKVLHDEVLVSNRFPTIAFRSVSTTNIQKSGNNRSFTLNGDVTLRGVTRRVAFPVKVTINGNQLHATGEENIKQSDFGITPYSGGLGAIKIGDQLKVSFTIVANSN